MKYTKYTKYTEYTEYQQAMLEAEWPEVLLTHEKAGVVLSTAQDSSRPGQLLFRGLRVRVAITTGALTECEQSATGVGLVFSWGSMTAAVTVMFRAAAAASAHHALLEHT